VQTANPAGAWSRAQLSAKTTERRMVFDKSLRCLKESLWVDSRRRSGELEREPSYRCGLQGRD
jgi:hypothetical protein